MSFLWPSQQREALFADLSSWPPHPFALPPNPPVTCHATQAILCISSRAAEAGLPFFLRSHFLKRVSRSCVPPSVPCSSFPILAPNLEFKALFLGPSLPFPPRGLSTQPAMSPHCSQGLGCPTHPGPQIQLCPTPFMKLKCHICHNQKRFPPRNIWI